MGAFDVRPFCVNRKRFNVFRKGFNVEQGVLYRRARHFVFRLIFARFLCHHCVYTQRDIGELLKIGNGVSLVSKQLKNLYVVLKTDRSVKNKYDNIKSILIQIAKKG